MRAALVWTSLCIGAASTARATVITNDRSVAVGKTFDYIIAGGGPTSLTVANKLSAAGNSVLVIEAGKNLPNEPGIYDAERRSELGTACNWKYPAYADDGSKLGWQIDSGKCVGGSTSINGMMWYRPTQKELDLLGRANPGWSWYDLEPYLSAIERNIPPTALQIAQGANFDPRVHGFHGPVNVSFPTPMRIPYGQALYKAAVPLVFPGLEVSADLSAREGSVCASASWTLWWDAVNKINHRSSAAFALLYPESQQRKKLTVLTEHRVASVIFDAKNVATGVRFGDPVIGNTVYVVKARKEVLLAAGSLQSAPILERSGIGSKRILSKFNITQLVELPGVGLNLGDQPGTGASALVKSEFMSNTSLIDNRNIFAPVVSLVNLEQLFGKEEAKSIAQEFSQTLEQRSQALVDAGAEVDLATAKLHLEGIAYQIVHDKMPVVEFIGESYPAVMTAIFWPLIPFSKGHVHIGSSAPFDDPVITPRLLSDQFDVKFAIKVARKSRELFLSKPFQEVVADAYADPATLGPDATDEEYAAWLRETSFGASHWQGSTAMLPREYGGVVDPKLRVYGTKNLRVIDAGILPTQITSHTQSMAYTIGLKAASLILGK
ncbi:alcohol oxidase [Auriculariales sp. MPI-PUGE-AT-0066]|nr:alcohol oxidase [Auriculariales sp. MPI-PUGE-AT-0066]